MVGLSVQCKRSVACAPEAAAGALDARGRPLAAPGAAAVSITRMLSAPIRARPFAKAPPHSGKNRISRSGPPLMVYAM